MKNKRILKKQRELEKMLNRYAVNKKEHGRSYAVTLTASELNMARSTVFDRVKKAGLYDE